MDRLSVIQILAFLLGLLLPYTIMKIINKNKYRGPGAKYIDDSACFNKGEPHEFLEKDLYLAIFNLEPKQYKICKKCGFISGTEYMLNEEALLMAHEKVKNMLILEKKNEEFKKAALALMEKTLKNKDITTEILEDLLDQLINLSNPQQSRVDQMDHF